MSWKSRDLGNEKCRAVEVLGSDRVRLVYSVRYVVWVEVLEQESNPASQF
jgi:hypothetical protein